MRGGLSPASQTILSCASLNYVRQEKQSASGGAAAAAGVEVKEALFEGDDEDLDDLDDEEGA